MEDENENTVNAYYTEASYTKKSVYASKSLRPLKK